MLFVCLAAIGLLTPKAGIAAPKDSKKLERPEKPNIVWIWADNLAYADLGVYGSLTNKTPVVDQLARGGVRLSQYYVAHVVCSPSRAGFLTGRQPFRVGIVDVLRPDSPSGIPDDEITLAEALKQEGYATKAIGKWHLGDRVEYLPKQHGFDSYFGLPYSMDMLPTILFRDNEIIERLPGQKVGRITERYTAEAIDFVTANRDRPFFLYFSHTIPHPPLTLPEDVHDENRPLYDLAIEYLDQQTGLFLDKLKELDLLDNTLVVFSSDNGPMNRGGNTGGLRGRIRDAYEGGIRVPLIASWPGQIPAGRVVDTPVIAYDFFPTLLQLAGGSLPSDRIYDGQDIWPLLSGRDSFQRKEPLFWVQDDRVTTIRRGKWKLHTGDRQRRFNTPELYDVEADPGESQNIAKGHPQQVAQLSQLAKTYESQLPKVWNLRYPVRDPAKRKSGVRRD